MKNNFIVLFKSPKQIGFFVLDFLLCLILWNGDVVASLFKIHPEENVVS